MGRGNRWLRAQRTDEREQVGEEAPNRRDKVGWTISQVDAFSFLVPFPGSIAVGSTYHVMPYEMRGSPGNPGNPEYSSGF